MDNIILIIALIGDNRCGKDTFADIIKSNGNFKQYAFADTIKDVARIVFDFNEQQLYGNEKEVIDSEWGISPRQFFQQFGTEIMQEDIYKYLPLLEEKVPKKEFWVRKTIKNIKKDIQNGINKFIISDVRFLHEAKCLTEFTTENTNIKLEVVSIKRPITINEDISFSDNNNCNNNHISRKSINQINDDFIKYDLLNDGSLEEYKEKCQNLIKKILDY